MAARANEGEGVVTSNCDLGEATGVIMGIILVSLRTGTGIVRACCGQQTCTFALIEGNMGVGKHLGLEYSNVCGRCWFSASMIGGRIGDRHGLPVGVLGT